jgi:hypothetical protein
MSTYMNTVNNSNRTEARERWSDYVGQHFEEDK